MNEFFTNNASSIVTSNRILYTPSSFARSSLLHLQEIGELEARRAHTSSRSGLQSFLFFTVVSGSGTLSYNDKISIDFVKLCIPMYNVACVLKEIISKSVNILHVGIVAGWLIIYSLISVAIMMRLFKKEDVIFRI